MKIFSKKVIISFTSLIVLCFASISIFTHITNAKSKVINVQSDTLYVGETLQLKLSGMKGTVKWSSSKSNIATVSKKGLVKAKKIGKATITAKSQKKKYTCKITVTAKNTVTPMPVATFKPLPTMKPMPTVTPLKVALYNNDYSNTTNKTFYIGTTKSKTLRILVSTYNYTVKNDTVITNSNPDIVKVENMNIKGDGTYKEEYSLTPLAQGQSTLTIDIDGIKASCVIDTSPIYATYKFSDDSKTTITGITNHADVEIADVPSGVTAIADGAINGENLYKVIIPNTVTTIGDYGISGKNLKEIYIPSSVKAIGKHVVGILMDDSYKKNCTIYGEDGSYAQQWAKKFGYTFVVK